MSRAYTKPGVRIPSPRLALALAAASLLAACGASVAAGPGERCGPSQGCRPGLTCENGACATPPGGARDGGATDGGSACGPCDTPPDVCHGTRGTCVSGACVYPVVDGVSCDDGNPCTVQDTCHGGTCAGTAMVCNTPPAPACLSGTELSTYDQTGTCQQGRCTYTQKTIQCTGGGCVNNACQTDPCASMTCNTPPSACYGTAGTCSGGSCTYPYADGTTCDDHDPCTTGDTCNTGVCQGQPIACNSPPASTCTNANTAKIYDAAGSCSAGTCSYTYHFVTCAAGCQNGACQASGWTRMSGSTTVDLYGVWGSSATDVWAVGQKGNAEHWDGHQWQVRPTGYTDDLIAIDGTAANNVFVATRSKYGVGLIRFDGTSWVDGGGPLGYSTTSMLAIHAIGPDDVVTAGYTSGCCTNLQIDEVNASGVHVLVTPGNSATYSVELGIWAFSTSDVYVAASELVHWDGSGYGGAGPLPDNERIWAASPTAIFVNVHGNVSRWDGTSWTLLNTGIGGTVNGLWGTAPNRVFAVGDTSDRSGASAVVTEWDGTGWTSASLPAGIPTLNGVWAAPNGEVFAVGPGGVILHGP